MKKMQGIFEKKELRSDAVICMLAAIMVLIAYGIIFGGIYFLHEKKCTFLIGDALIQYTPIIKMYLRHLFEMKSLDYSFEIGMGMPTRALYAFYSLSPFNIIFILIKDIEKAVICLVILKMMMAGATFAYLLRKTLKTSGSVTLACSIMYALCGFVLNYYYSYLFLDSLYLMPLVVYLLIQFVRTGKWRALSLVYAITFIIQFYLGYTIGVFSVSVLLCFLAQQCGTNWKLWIKYIGKYAGCVFVAILLSAPVTYPAARELFKHLGSDATTIKDTHLGLMPWEFLAALYPGHAESAFNHYPMVYSGVPTILLSFLFLTNSRKSLSQKVTMFIPIIFLLICTFFAPAYLMIHGFDIPDGYSYRFSWQYGFWLLYISAGEMQDDMKEQRGKWIIGGAFFCGLGYFILFLLLKMFSPEQEQILTVQTGVICLGLLMIYAMIIKGWKEKRHHYLFLIMVIIEMIWNGGNIVEKTVLRNAESDREYYNIWQEQADTAMEYIQSNEKESNSFFRVRNLNCLDDNVSMLYGYHGLGYFSSIENESVRNVLKQLGYATSSRMVEDYGSMAFTRMLFAQKYSLECGYWLGTQRGYYTLKKNEKVLPIGFMVSDAIEGFSMESNNPFENQVELANTMMGSDGSLYHSYEGEYTIDAEGVEIWQMQGGFRMHKVNDQGGGVVYGFYPDEGRRLYVYVSRFGRSVCSDSPRVYSKMDIGGMMDYSMMYMPHIIPMNEVGEKVAMLYVESIAGNDENVDYEAIYAAYENEDELEHIYQELSKGGMMVMESSDDMIRGTIEVEPERTLLFTTIPYDKGWEIDVDGKKAATIPVLGNGFLATHLEPGYHEICFRYVNNSVKVAYIIGMIGIVLVVDWKRKTKNMLA